MCSGAYHSTYTCKRRQPRDSNVSHQHAQHQAQLRQLKSATQHGQWSSSSNDSASAAAAAAAAAVATVGVVAVVATVGAAAAQAAPAAPAAPLSSGQVGCGLIANVSGPAMVQCWFSLCCFGSELVRLSGCLSYGSVCDGMIVDGAGVVQMWSTLVN